MILGSKPQHSIAIAASKQAPVSVGLPYVASSVMHEAALRAQVAPVRLSLINSLSILRKAVFEFQIITESQKATQHDCLLGEIAREKLPARANRFNSRVVKHKMSSFEETA